MSNERQHQGSSPELEFTHTVVPFEQAPSFGLVHFQPMGLVREHRILCARRAHVLSRGGVILLRRIGTSYYIVAKSYQCRECGGSSRRSVPIFFSSIEHAQQYANGLVIVRNTEGWTSTNRITYIYADPPEETMTFLHAPTDSALDVPLRFGRGLFDQDRGSLRLEVFCKLARARA